MSSRRDGPADLWDSGRVTSSDVAAEYAGKPLKDYQQAFWRVRTWSPDGAISPWSESGRWSVGPAHEEDWHGSEWIAREVLLENTQEKMPGDVSPIPEPSHIAAPYLRKEFEARGSLRSALLTVSGLAYAEVYVNGTKLGASTERDPGFTNFERRVLYVTHDVMELLVEGHNAMGAILGTGWYDVHDVATWHFNTAPWRQRPRVRITLAMQYANGSREFVVSDETWHCATGPILRDGIYTGETYDARLEMPGWSAVGFDASKWTPALVVEAPRGRLVPLSCEPIRITDTLSPKAITQPAPGVFIVDMGQNFSGHVQLRLKGPSGHAITMRYAEILNGDGTLNSTPIDHFMEKTTPRQPFQQDTYICKGTGEDEIWEQRFSYSGFQYVEVTNFPGTPTLDNFRGRFAHTDVTSAGEFLCSDEIATKIQHAARWSYLSNAQSYPTDCPQREKNGWTGDAGLAVECGLMNFQSSAFYNKWLDDFADAQRPDGGVPVLVPNGGWGNGERWPGDLCPPWDAAYPIIVWNVYRYGGDRRVIARHVEPLKRYVEFFLKHRGSSGLVNGLGLGDWSPWKTQTPLDFISNAYLYLDLSLLVQMYEALEALELSKHYRGLRDQVFAAFQRQFYDAKTHRYANGSQTAQSTALYFGLVPEAERAGVFAEMARDVEQMGHLDTGILGAKHLLRALSAGGRTDLAFHLATQQQLPGWGYWMKVGATTLWEGWKAGPSYNHIMFGDVSAWFYAWIAGIQQENDSVGFKEIVFRPNPVGSLKNASANYMSPHGRISSAWQVEGDRMHIALEVPCSSSARLVLPANASFVGVPTGRFEGGRYEVEVVLR